MVTIVTKSLLATFSPGGLLLSFSIISLVIEFRCCLCGAGSDVAVDPAAAAVDLPSSILIIEGALPAPVPVFAGTVLSSFIRLTPPSTVATVVVVVVAMLSPVGIVAGFGTCCT